MNQIIILSYQILIVLLYLANTFCQDKYVHSSNSQIGKFHMLSAQMKENEIMSTQQFTKFNTTPKILLGISYMFWNEFKNKENEFNLYTQDVNKSSANIYLSTTTESSGNMKNFQITFFAFVSDEAQIYNIKLVEQDFDNWRGGTGDFFRTEQKLIRYKLQKKPNSKRSVSCFIIGYRQEFSAIPPSNTNEKISFFVETKSEIDQDNFQLFFAALYYSDALKWVNLNCIEYYEYDKNYEPFEFIQSINENKYSYSKLISDSYSNKYLLEKNIFEIKSQAQDISFNKNQIFIGFNGFDQQIYNYLLVSFENSDIEITEKSSIHYDSLSQKLRAVTSSFILFKMKNCPENCENCSDLQTCQKCKLKYTMSNGKCISCKDNCNSCDSNLNCTKCEVSYYLFQGVCFKNKPNGTYCKYKPYSLI